MAQKICFAASSGGHLEEISKLKGIREQYEPFARVNSPSLTGKLMYRIADLFIVQWKDMLQFYLNAIYGGGFF